MNASVSSPPKPARRIALFVTCLIDLFRPTIGFASVKLLESAGCQVDVPAQSCCGQPAFNSGDENGARRVARRMIEAFASADTIVVPSGSCAGMIIEHYPALFAQDGAFRTKAEAVAAKTVELTTFIDQLAREEGASPLVNAKYAGKVTYHDSCSGLRELSIQEQPRRLLSKVEGLSLTEMTDSNVCCGFGGTFCVKYPDISTRLVDNKIDNIVATGADTLAGGDLGCLMNIAGRLKRLGHSVRVYHTAELAAGVTDVAPIAGTDSALPSGVEN